MLTVEELKKLSVKEMEEEFKKAKIQLLRLRLGVAGKQEKQTGKFKPLRRYIARMKTVEKLMEIEKAKEQPKSSVTK